DNNFCFSYRVTELREVAEKFEAIFLNEFMKQARQTKLADDIFGSSAKTTYEQMLDREYADQLSGKINLGIADALVEQLSKRVK
ncbi:MAG: rod-binding protein, partial [Alphaproteobacteria bacterium]